MPRRPRASSNPPTHEQALPGFGEATRRWFAETLGAPTRVQELGWPVLARGEHALLVAPTGTGKTLAALLACLDRLIRAPRPAHPGVRVLYLSPLKALAADMERNLRAPLEGIRRLATHEGLTCRDVELDVRTGDTSASERRRQARAPGEVLITTPESLFLILGSAARETLRTVETVVVDEIHALAPSKRGVHLALSLERLACLTARDPQRIGLSATMRPLERVAAYLGGDRPVTVVDAAERPRLELAVRLPQAEPTPQAGVWPILIPELLAEIRAHRSTIVFVNSRRVAERVARALNELAGEELVLAHHGSLAREQRRVAEEALKTGALRGMVATSSLELGIDMGAVDLVIQVEAPAAVTQALQRLGRAGHSVGETSRGLVFAKSPGDLLNTAVVAERTLSGAIEELQVPDRTLDVLAQQVVGMVTVEPWRASDLLRVVTRAASFRGLSRDALDAVLEMLAGRYPSDAFADLRPRLVWDRRRDELTARPGARTISLVNAGTIVDRGLYAVRLGEGGPRVGELDEEMVYESRVGEVFLLGASSWRIEAIQRDEVIVRPAPGEPGKMPFWKGEGPGRPVELGRAIGAFVRELAALPPAKARARLVERHRLDLSAADRLLAYLAEQKEATGTLPTDRAITVERFRDELGDFRLCILSPFGARLHAPWALLLEARLSHRAGFSVESVYTDNGIVLRFSGAEPEALPGADDLVLSPEEVEPLLVEQLRHAPLFAAHFRENAARSLLLPRRRAGQRAPLWSQRQRARELLGVALKHPRFPIVLETYRECLKEVFDLPALLELLGAIRSRKVRLEEVETRTPSPFARGLVFAFVAAYLYEGDAPAAERRAQALTLDRTLLRELLGEEALRDLLDGQAVGEVEEELQRLSSERRARTADELHDLLRQVGDLSLAEVEARTSEDPRPWLEDLRVDGRALALPIGGDARFVAVEDAARYRDGLGVTLPGELPAALLEPVPEALEGLLLRQARRRGPFHAATLADRYALPVAAVEALLRALVARGELVHAELLPGGTAPEWCHVEVLPLLRRRSLARLRNAVAPVGPEAVARFLPRWQGLDSPAGGLPALRRAVTQLEGLALPLSELLGRVLPARVAGFRPAQLDELGAAGELVWVGAGALGRRDGRVRLFRRERARELLEPAATELPAEYRTPIHEHILVFLASHGASFAVALRQALPEVPPAELHQALWELVFAGLVTNDTFAPLAEHLGTIRRASAARLRRGGRPRRAPSGVQTTSGRWSTVASLASPETPPTARALAWTELLLERYGLVTPGVVAAEGLEGGFARLAPILRELEAHGRVRRGYFVEGAGGLQYALPGAIDGLREARDGGDEELTLLGTSDPACPYGSLLAWPELRRPELAGPARRAGTQLVLLGGRPALVVSGSGRRVSTFAGEGEATLLAAFRDGLRTVARERRRLSIRVDEVDGEPALLSALRPLLERAGFRGEAPGLVLELTR
ncbi:MAG: DEAD/DEAH box helicase [Deltaproteobacteria bacterium]|nr:DEAD/DEAH box helicase [Deltaproteobacteria bacterium]